MVLGEGTGLAGLAAARALPHLLVQAGISLAAMDGHGRLSLLSPTLEQTLGRRYCRAPASELPRLYSLFDEHGLSLVCGEHLPLSRARRGETVVNVHLVVQTPTGHRRHLRVNATHVPASEGDYRGSLAVVEDVTCARQGTATFDELQSLLAQRVSHELRTPLTTILGHAELLEEEPALPEQARGSVTALRRAAGRLHDLADRLTHLGGGER